MPYVTFKMPTGTYIFDRATHCVHSISEDSFSELMNGKQIDDIDEIKSLNIGKQGEIDTILHPETNHLEFFLSKQIEDIVLQVTQNCNLRCNYCVYSGKYQGRAHTLRKMPLETAYKVVDFAIEHSSETENLNIGFYGGEPLLEYDLIRSVVEYTKLNYSGKNISYSMTTNATLLDKEKIDFFNDNNFRITVSLDGPKAIHDLERTFPNGQGSFDTTYNNLILASSIVDNFEHQYFTNTVLGTHSDYRTLSYFFESDPILKNMHTSIGIISDFGLKEPVKYSDDLYVFEQEERMKLLLSLCNRLSVSNVSTLTKTYIGELEYFYKMFTRPNFASNISHPGGPCIPGIKKTFVDVDGNLYPCEKITEDISLSIGTIYEGYNINKAKSMLNIGQLTASMCKNCWAFNLCNICVAACYDGKTISQSQRLLHCDKSKNAALNKIMDVIFLQENGYRFGELLI